MYGVMVAQQILVLWWFESAYIDYVLFEEKEIRQTKETASEPSYFG